ncbi:MAG: acyl-CoA dehydratase activase [Deltaproteobacteria bacterium]|nr:acyl-CoA dehydratase activase [Deltaproteobacteria bacterium]
MEIKGSIGIDIGSTTFKVIVLDSTKRIVYSKIMPTETVIVKQVNDLFSKELLEFKREEYRIIATGYGKEIIKIADRRFTEITCHLRGIFEEFRRSCTIVDIGGQDSKVIKCNQNGELVDFIMNDKCSAGTGRFLENIALRFNINISELGEIARNANIAQPISSTCTVFAESEIISLLSQGIRADEILKGLHLSLVKRIKSMVKSIGLEPPLILSGGVSLNPAIRELLGRELGVEPLVSVHPQFTAAYGAALLGLKKGN